MNMLTYMFMRKGGVPEEGGRWTRTDGGCSRGISRSASLVGVSERRHSAGNGTPSAAPCSMDNAAKPR